MSNKQKVSNYTTDDLPTWGEIWEQFWLNKVFFHDPENPEHNLEGMAPNTNPVELLNREDPYWKRPHRKILLGWIANQFNKMLFEDGCDSIIADFIAEMTKWDDIDERGDVRFFLCDRSKMNNQYLYPYSREQAPPVYYVNRPETGERHVMATSHPAIDMDSFTGPVELVVSMLRREDEMYVFITESQGILEDLVIKLLHTPYGNANESIWNYYDGAIGFKNEQGEVMESETPQRRGCSGSGVDAAL